MPLYEYQCQACTHRLELLEKVSATPTTTCPACQAEALKRLVSAPAFQLKGDGWYVTDFRDKGKPKKSTESGNKTSKGSDD
jgi:putative FmdB family regulatory protein